MKGEVKKAAKRGDQDVAKTLAREIVRSRKACNRLHVSKTQLNSVMMQMEQQLAQQKMLGTMQKSAVVMGAMNKLVKVGAIAEVMQNMQKEMCKAGIIEEMVDDAMSSLEGEDEEDAADAEVEYRIELADHPHDVWSLTGLQRALDSQGRSDPAVAEDLRAGSARVDHWFDTSRF